MSLNSTFYPGSLFSRANATKAPPPANTAGLRLADHPDSIHTEKPRQLHGTRDGLPVFWTPEGTHCSLPEWSPVGQRARGGGNRKAWLFLRVPVRSVLRTDQTEELQGFAQGPGSGALASRPGPKVLVILWVVFTL